MKKFIFNLLDLYARQGAQMGAKMYVIAGLILFLYALWWLAARKEQTDAAQERMLRPFCRMAQLLYKKICCSRLKAPQTERVRRDWERLYPGGGKSLTDYYVRKLGIALAVLLMGVLFSTAVRVQADAGKYLTDGGVLTRGKYGEGDRELVLEARVESGGRHRLEVNVPVRMPGREEAERLFGEFREALSRKALGENESWQKVTQDLDLAEELQGYPFRVSWESSRPELVSDTGLVTAPEELEGGWELRGMEENGEEGDVEGDDGEGDDGEIDDGEGDDGKRGDRDGEDAGVKEAGIEETEREAVLTATVTLEDWEWVERFLVRVLPPPVTETEWQKRELERLVSDTERAFREEQQFALPEELYGKRILWRQKTEDGSLLFFSLTVAAAASVYFFSDQDLHGQVEKRKRRLRDTYPLLANKLALYLGAGMTIRGAFLKIGEESRNSPGNPAYDEILHTCHELQSGVSEGAALQNLGRRTGLQEYARLCTLLSQNLKKGNKTLLTRLQEESEKALQERINRRKQAGEEASTKLLLPMVMMLVVVMIIIMIPAFSSFGI